MQAKSIRWSVGSAAFFLPAAVGILGDALERLPSFNSPQSSRLVVLLFGLSVFVAAAIPAGLALEAPIPVLRRLGLVVLLWGLLCLQVVVLIAWSMRGLH